MAGGTGSRLYPITRACNKHLLPVFDKPLIYYPLSTMMLSGIREVLVISGPGDLPLLRELLGDGEEFGLAIDYREQTEPGGIAEGLLIGESFCDSESIALVLGDNLLHGPKLGTSLATIDASRNATLFAYEVADPREYGVVSINDSGHPIDLEEKPAEPGSKLAVPGLYFYPPDAPSLARRLIPSQRGELEITDLNRAYLEEGRLRVVRLPRGTAWLDTGKPENLHDASTYVRVLEERQGLRIGCPEEIAWRNGWISDEQLGQLAARRMSSPYGRYLSSLLQHHPEP